MPHPSTKNPTDSEFRERFFGDVLFRYSRQDALNDGTLVDVSQTAREVGFRIPVAVTAALWADIEAIPEGSGQDTSGRVWDVLFMARTAISQAVVRGQGESPELVYELILRVAGQDAALHKPSRVKSVIGPGDAGEAVLTLMRPDED